MHRSGQARCALIRMNTLNPGEDKKNVCRQQGVASVAAGESHSLALEFDGTVWAWGLGNDGQLGHEVIASVMKQNVNTQRPIVLHEPKRIATLRPENLPAHDRYLFILLLLLF